MPFRLTLTFVIILFAVLTAVSLLASNAFGDGFRAGSIFGAALGAIWTIQRIRGDLRP